MNYIDQLIYNRIHKVKTFKTLFKLIVIMTPPILATVWMLILEVSSSRESIALNWIGVILFVPTIYTTLILIQRYDLIGNYGESILLLIPTFVWLLPGNVEAINIMLLSSLSLSVIAVVLFIIAVLLPVFSKKTMEEKTQKYTKLSSILIRIGYALVAVVSTVVVSIVLVEWADFSMKWSEVINIAGDPEPGNYTAASWILFIGVVTLLTAFALVVLGLISSYEESKKGNINKTDNIQSKLDKFIEKRSAYNVTNRGKTQTIDISTIKQASKKFKKRKVKEEKESNKNN